MRRALLCVLLLGACEEQVTTCRSASACIGRDGTYGLCLMMRCAFLDDACASKYRFDDSAGVLANMCVDQALVPDAALPDARVRDAATRD